MRIISRKTVEVTPAEDKASDTFNGLLDRGYGIVSASLRTEEMHPNLDPAFYRWLRDEPLMPA